MQHPRTKLATLAAAALTVAVTGCSMNSHPGQPSSATSHESTASQQPGSASSQPSSSSQSTASGDRSSDSGGTSSDAEISLGFAGDIHFAQQLESRLQKPSTALDPIAPALQRPDLTMVNLETAITKRGKPEPKRFHFRTKPAALQALQGAGADVATMANNHAVDYGKEGLTDTLAAKRDSPIPVVGIGKDKAAAFRPAIKTTHGVRVAFLAATTLPDRTGKAWAAGSDKPGVAYAPLPKPQLVKQVHKAKKHADVVVVYLHWGGEKESCPYWRQKKHAKALAAAGANVVVGSHAHVLLGSGWLDGTYINYGLGNFVWYRQAPSADTGVLTLRLRHGKVVKDSFAPARIGSDGLPRLRSGHQQKRARAKWRKLNHCTKLSSSPPH